MSQMKNLVAYSEHAKSMFKHDLVKDSITLNEVENLTFAEEELNSINRKISFNPIFTLSS